MPKIIIAGSINMDCVVRMPRRPRAGETLHGTSVAYFPGGKGANQAVAAARLDGNVTMIGCVGKDAFGDDLTVFLKEENINLRVGVSDTQATGMADIHLTDDGENSIVIISGANSEVSAGKIKDVLTADNISNALCVAQNEIPLESVYAFFELARENNCQTIYNPAPMVSDEKLHDIFALSDVVIVNETELQTITGSTDKPQKENDIFALIEKFRKDSQAIIVTRGAEGLVAIKDNEKTILEGHSVTPVDTTGAGDCFVGAFSTALSQKKGFTEALKYANKAASIAVTREGAGTGMPYAHEF